MILADTSAWVEYDRATGSAVDRRIAELVTGDQLCVTELVILEVVAGARDEKREQDLRRLMLSFRLLPYDVATDFDAAARIYLQCRRRGVTPHGMVDCMVAAVAWRTGAALLAHDTDLARVADVIGLSMDPGS